jgi:hypothetical protein
VKVRFLLDEDLSPQLQAGLRRRIPSVDILRVGDAGAPFLGTPDEDILHFLEDEQRLLVTNNRTSMPDHLTIHYAGGSHHWGLVWIRPGTSIGQVIDVLALKWSASESEEWYDRVEWIPFR